MKNNEVLAEEVSFMHKNYSYLVILGCSVKLWFHHIFAIRYLNVMKEL